MKKITKLDKFTLVANVLEKIAEKQYDELDMFTVGENEISLTELTDFVKHEMYLLQKKQSAKSSKSNEEYIVLSGAIAEVLTGHEMTVTEIINSGKVELSTLSTSKVTSVLKKMMEDDNYSVKWDKVGRKSLYSM